MFGLNGTEPSLVRLRTPEFNCHVMPVWLLRKKKSEQEEAKSFAEYDYPEDKNNFHIACLFIVSYCPA